MNTSLRVILLTVCLLALLLPLGCQRESTGSGSSGPRVGVSLLTQQHDFYKDLEEGMRAEAEKHGIELLVLSAEFDASRQATQLESFVTQRLDAIVVCPCDSAGAEQAIRRVNEAKIPVFTADIAAAGGDVVSHIASDNVQGGRLAAQTLAKLLGGKGDILIIDHPEVASVQERVQGFQEEIKKWPDIRIVDTPSAGGRRDKATAVTETKLQANPDLRGIFAINDDSALGAARAVKDGDVVIVGYDATPEARAAILAGKALKADVVQFPKEIGRRTVQAIHQYLSGDPDAVPPVIPVAVDIVDRESLQEAG